MNTTEDDDVGIDGLALARQLERVADEVRDFEDLRPLIVVGENHRVALALEGSDACRHLGQPRALVRGVHVRQIQLGKALLESRAAGVDWLIHPHAPGLCNFYTYSAARS